MTMAHSKSFSEGCAQKLVDIAERLHMEICSDHSVHMRIILESCMILEGVLL